MEEGFANSMGWKLGDRVAFDIAGQRLEATVTSLREVEWESFRPNFIVLVSPGSLAGYAASYITAVHVPAERTRFTAELVARHPNLSVVDIDALLRQVRGTADQVSTVVEVVFYFSLLAGLLVLMAAVSASQDERLLEGGVMRVLGGSRGTRCLTLSPGLPPLLAPSPRPPSPAPPPLAPAPPRSAWRAPPPRARRTWPSAPSVPSRLRVQKRSLSRSNPCLRMKADCVPPSSPHARTTCTATSGVHIGRRAASNCAGSVFVVAVFVVIAPLTLRPLEHLHYLGRNGGLRRIP